ncbi:hypothetical protein Moror_6071 [Moniliophthora roreri MCA 2997]|uniref:Uncharacterized protein n=1 Tax=Moniliophthora roreri (strain MCA 2997) TaxID=1381753 RepID=V2W8E0_MONRO|nr:hypothetical protein Moror_6071 [Moniliophthora roreri MCA 2997]
MNCEHYDEELTTAINASNERNCALYGSLIFLRGQRRQMMENVTRMDRHMGTLAQQISDDKTFTVTGAIAVLRPALDIANLPLHIVLPDTDPDGDRFAMDDDVSPNDPVFLRKTLAHRRSLKRATEVSKGQHLLQLRQRCIGTISTPVPSPSFPQTYTTGRVDASTNRRSPTPVAGVSSLPADQRTLLYPDPFPITDDTRSDDSDVSNASGRAAKFPNISPSSTLPAMSPSHELPSTSSGTTEPSRKTFHAARLSPELPNPLHLPSPIIPINPDTQRPYRIGVGRPGHRARRQGFTNRNEIKRSYNAYYGVARRGSPRTECPVCKLGEHCTVDCVDYVCPVCNTHKAGHLPGYCRDRRRSTRTMGRNDTSGTSTLDNDWRHDTTWDDADYGNGEQ